MTNKPPKNILFLCTGNSCRSQMAEGWAKALLQDQAAVYSAGTVKHGLNPRAVKAMAEQGIDISGHHSKTVEDLSAVSFDLVITVCQDAHENCPFIPGVKIIHHGFDDPPRLTKAMSDEQEIMAVYRRVCLEIKAFVETMPQLL